MQILGKPTTIDFMGKRRITAVLSAALIVISILSIATRGLNLGIDFTGGVLIEVRYEDAADLGSIRALLAAGGLANALVQNFGSASEVLIRVLPEEGAESGQIGEQMMGLLTAGDQSVDLRQERDKPRMPVAGDRARIAGRKRLVGFGVAIEDGLRIVEKTGQLRAHHVVAYLQE